MSLDKYVDKIISTDVLIIGSEGAGARAAIKAAEKGVKVTVTTKGVIAKSGATLTADADIDIDSRSCIELFGLPGDKNDSPEKFFEDIVIEGEYLNDQQLVEVMVQDAPQRLKELVDWGARIDKLTHAPGHRYPRGVWIPGTEFVRVLKKEIKKRSIDLLEHMMVTDLIVDQGKLLGAVGIDMLTGEFYLFKTKTVIICAGGAMRMYPHTTAPEELTGDGLAMALRCGVKMMDMEFPMFLPYTLIKPSALDGVDFSYLLSAYVDVHALNRTGYRYMQNWDPIRLEKSTRDVNSIAAGVEILEGRGSPNGGTYLSFKHLPENLLTYAGDWFPESISGWKYGGFNMKNFLPDLSRDALETAPASHFWTGGVKINKKCQTNIEGLFAAGEGTGGIHGANRVSGNALTMTQVWGPIAGEEAANFAVKNKQHNIPDERVNELKDKYLAALTKKDGISPIELRNEIRVLAWNNVGVVRNGESLKKALTEIEKLKESVYSQATQSKGKVYNKEWIEALQNENLVQCMEMVARSSLLREESRGALYRTDFPDTDNEKWIKNIVVELNNGTMELKTEQVVITTMAPPKNIRKYGTKE